MNMPATVFLCVMVFLIGLVSGAFSGSQYTEASYSTEIAKITQDALVKQSELQTKINEINHELNKSSNAEKERIKALQRQLRDKRDSVSCSKVAGSNNVAIVSPGAVRVLVESASYRSLPETQSKSCPFGSSETITANLLARYTVCIIGQYNTKDRQLNQLLRAIAEFNEAQAKK